MLRDEFGTLAALNDLLGLGKRDSTLSQYLNQATGTKTSKPKVMGSPMARRLEKVCGKEIGWMDTDPQLQASAAAYEAIAAQILHSTASQEAAKVNLAPHERFSATDEAHMPQTRTFGTKRAAPKSRGKSG